MQHTMARALLILLGISVNSPLFAAASPSAIEFKKHRLEYAAEKAPILNWVANKQRAKLLQLYKADNAQFVIQARKWLELCPIDAKVHLMVGYALSDLNKSEESLHHRYIFYGLLQSISESGDGLSVDTAYKVVSVDEEYTLCNYFKYKVKEQKLEGSCDVLTVDNDGKERKIYFDVSTPLTKLQKELDERHKE